MSHYPKGCSGNEPSPGFVQAVKRIFGNGVGPHLVLALFWGGTSIFTLAYPVAVPALAWANDLAVLTALVYASALLAYGASKLDFYLHDIQQIGRLERRLKAGELGR